MPPEPVEIDPAQAADASGHHPLIVHYGHYLVPGLPAWSYGEAVAVAFDYWGGPGLSITGPDDDAALLAEFLGERVPWRLSLPVSAVGLLPAGFLADTHGWTFHWVEAALGVAPSSAATWLPRGDSRIAGLLANAFPNASVGVSSPRALRWAAILGEDGAALACAADATGSPGVGFVASIACHPRVRGRGLGRLVTAWTLDQLVANHGVAALWVDAENHPAARMYESLGMRTAAMVSGATPATRRTG